MKTIRLNYPWQQLKKGEGFFVPSLDPETLRKELLIDALKHHVYGHATVGIRGEKLGVLFTFGRRAYAGNQPTSES